MQGSTRTLAGSVSDKSDFKPDAPRRATTKASPAKTSDARSGHKDRNNQQTGLTYDNAGNLKKLAFPDGTNQTLTHNAANQLTQIAATNSSSITLTSFSYSYTNPGTQKPTDIAYNVTDVSNNTTSYSYDGNNQLTQALQKNGSGSTLNTWAFGYDPAGNLTSKTMNGKTMNGTNTTFTYNAANELTQASGGMNMTYSYDGNGDLVSRSDNTQVNVNTAVTAGLQLTHVGRFGIDPPE